MISTGTRGLYRRRTRASRQATLFGAALMVISSLVSVRATAAADQPSKNFAKRVDIGGGRSMYLECRGSGSPTVLLVVRYGHGVRPLARRGPEAAEGLHDDRQVHQGVCVRPTGHAAPRRDAEP